LWFIGGRIPLSPNRDEFHNITNPFADKDQFQRTISRSLKDLGRQLIAAHARQIRVITTCGLKDDKNDSEKLACSIFCDSRRLALIRHRSPELAGRSLLRAIP
jgi:hypothetical protein